MEKQSEKKRDRENEMEDSDEEFKPTGEQVNVEFEFFDLEEEIDYLSLKNLMLNYLDGEAWNVADITNDILAKKKYGSSIKVGGKGEDVLGFISFLNIKQKLKNAYMQQILNYVKKAFSKDGNVLQLWEKILNEPKIEIGILFNERLINVPIQLAPHLHRIFFEEVTEASKEIQCAKPFLCDYFLIITKTFGVVGNNNQTKKKKTKEESEEFYKEEERIYRKHAEFQICFPIEFLDQTSRWTFQSDINQSKLLFVIKAEKIPQILKEIEEYIKVG